MLSKNKMSILVIAISLIAVFSIQSIAGANTIIKCASAFEPGHILVQSAEHFKDLVETRSNGEIEVQLFVGGVMGSEEECTEAVSIGAVEMQVGGGLPIKTYAPEYYFVDSPFVMRDWDHFMAVWNGEMGQEIRDIVLEKGNTMYLGVVYRGLRHFTSNKPIFTVEDVQGLKLRLPNLPTWVESWKEVGALPVPIALTELFSALQMGVADASEGDLVQVQSFHLEEVQEYVSLTSHQVQTGGLTFNKGFFDQLSEEHQQIILEAGKEASEWGTQQILEGETRILVDLQQKGMKVAVPDSMEFFEKAKPAVERLFETEWPVTTWKEVLSY